MNKMTSKAFSRLHSTLGKKAKITKDPAARDVKSLEDTLAMSLAREFNCRVYDVYIEALNLGISPIRYIRNREIISIEEQLQLAKSCVAVIGAGGLGGHVILLLARLGIGRLVVVDNDVFDETNMNRQALSAKESLGHPKSEVAFAAVDSINPAVIVTGYQQKIDSSNAKAILGTANVAVDALDNVRDRLILEEAAKKLGIPLIHGALAGFEGQIMTIFPEDIGLRQLYGNGEGKDDQSKRPESVLGVPTPTPSLIATLQVMEVIKVLLKRGKIFRNKMLHVDLETGNMNEFNF